MQSLHTKKSKSLFEPSEKTKLILVSGIPGSGKGTLGKTLARLFNTEGLQTVCMPYDVHNSL